MYYQLEHDNVYTNTATLSEKKKIYLKCRSGFQEEEEEEKDYNDDDYDDDDDRARCQPSPAMNCKEPLVAPLIQFRPR